MRKVNISITDQTLEYIDQKAKEIGVNRSAMISFMAEMYRRSDESSDILNQIKEVLSKKDQE